jgi:hypothetical protein
MPELDLAAIKERLAAITPGHWVAGIDIEPEDGGYWAAAVVYAVDEVPMPDYSRAAPDAQERCDAVSAWADVHCTGHVADTHNYFSIPDEEHDANQRLIAHAPADLKALLAHVDLLAGLLTDSMLILRDVWTAGSAEGRFRDLWNLAGRVDAVLEPKSVPIFMPDDLG